MAIDKPIKTLAMTSANVSEGKSTVTDNVAVVWAQTGQKVLLIDSDLRRPTLHATFNQSNQHGLTTILTSGTNSVDLREIIQPSGVDNLDILTAGPIPPNPAELLNSQRMKTLLDTVKGHLDAVVLVVKQGQTQKLAVKRAVELLNLAHANLLGYVMNDVNADGDAAYGYGYGYGYGEDTNK